MKILQTVLLILALSAPAFGGGVEDEFSDAWRLVKFTTLNGLPTNQVLDVVESPDGTVWCSTTRGIAWYDGYLWITMDSVHGAPQTFIAETSPYGRNGILLVTDGGLYRGDTSGFEKIVDNFVHDAVPLPDGSILVNTLLSTYILPADGSSHHEYFPSLTQRKTSDLLWTSGGSIWACLSSGVYRLENGRLRSMVSSEPPGFQIGGLDEDSARNGFAALYPRNPSVTGKLFSWTRGGAPVELPLDNQYVFNQIVVDNKGEIFALSKSGELLIRERSRWKQLMMLNYQIQNITSVKIRKNGDLWICSGGGLYLYKRSSTRWRYMISADDALSNVVSEILPARNGDLWLGTADGIIRYLADGTKEIIREIDHRRLVVVTGIAEDTSGNIFISSGASFTGYYRWDGKLWAHAEIDSSKKGIFIHKIRKDRKGNLWFLGLSPALGMKGPGAFVMREGKIEPWGERQGLLNGRVYSFAEGLDGSVWFGTGGGLSRWKDGSWRHWTVSEGLRHDLIFTLAVDQNNRLWFGDRLYGLGYIDDSSKPKYLTPADGLISNQVWDLAIGSDNALWIATTDGLSRFRGGIFTSYRSGSGLKQPRIWPLSVSGGRVFVGTQGTGAAALDDRRDRADSIRVLAYSPIIEDQTTLIRWRVFSFWEYQPTEEILSRYRMDRGRWSQWSTDREATFSNLPSGAHSLHLQALNASGEQIYPQAEVSFVIYPPFYLRTSFYFPILLVSLVTIFLLIYQASNKRKYTRALQGLASQLITTEERERRRIAEYLHDAIGQSLAFCKIKLGALQESAPSSVITEVRGQLDEAITKTHSLTLELSPFVLSGMTLAETIEWLVEEMQRKGNLFISFEKKGEMADVSEETRLIAYAIVRELLMNVIKHAKARSAEVHLRNEGKYITIEVIDDGKGFVVVTPRRVPGRYHGYGLFNVRERLHSVGGSIDIDSRPQTGTHITLKIPFNTQSQ